MESNHERGYGLESGVSGAEKRVPDLAHVLGVDPVSALAIENALFDVRDIAARRVSYVLLREAGVAPVAADRLRREYSLVWSFVWTEGAHLLQRAEQLRTLRDPERAWLVASVPRADRRDHAARRRWAAIRAASDESRPLAAAPRGSVDQPDAGGSTATDTPLESCPRCGDDLSTYALDACEAVTCDGCGYARLATDNRVETPERSSWAEALRTFVADR
jgi:Zn ribbon nucleic-acid-binding protein